MVRTRFNPRWAPVAWAKCIGLAIRDVAIRVLPEHLSSKADLQRFEAEARAISALNHPRICTLHDVGHQDGVDFLVMEYLEGETLAQRLKRGRVPLKEALKIGVEICEALDKAHRAGIIHRDLKPGNIMPDGKRRRTDGPRTGKDRCRGIRLGGVAYAAAVGSEDDERGESVLAADHGGRADWHHPIHGAGTD